MKDNILQKISWSTLFLAMSFILYFAFCTLYPYKTMEMKQPNKVLTPVVKPGEDLIYEVDYCKYTNRSVILSKVLVDTVHFNLGAARSNLPCGCNKVQVAVPMPKILELNGTYHLDIRAEYQMNPFRTIIVETRTEDFIIDRGTE